MPAPAVIPAPIAYCKVAAVETFVVVINEIEWDKWVIGFRSLVCAAFG